MPTENVVPIDADAALTLHRRTRRFRWFVAALTIFWLAVLVPVLALTPLPPLGPLVVLAGLLVLAEHRFVLFGDETSMSASIIVAIASVFAFADSSPIAGPMLVASFGGLYLPHLRDRQFGKVAVNAAGMSLSALATSSVCSLLTLRLSPTAVVALGPTLSVVIYWLSNNGIVSSYLAVIKRSPYQATLRLLLTSDTEVLLWAWTAGFGVASLSPNVLAQFIFLVSVVARYRTSWGMGGQSSMTAQRGFLRELAVPTALLSLATSAVALITPTSSIPIVVAAATVVAAASANLREDNNAEVVPFIALPAMTDPIGVIGLLILPCFVALPSAIKVAALRHRSFALLLSTFAIGITVHVIGTETVAFTTRLMLAGLAAASVPVVLRMLQIFQLRARLGYIDIPLAIGFMIPAKSDALFLASAVLIGMLGGYSLLAAVLLCPACLIAVNQDRSSRSMS